MMAGLQSLPTQVERTPERPSERGNAIPILHEVRHALSRLLATGEDTRIDLSSIPFGPGDERSLLEALGNGEVTATAEALGPTLVRETAVPGVWVVDYRNTEGERLALHLEIATAPEILRTPPEELATAISILDARLEEAHGGARIQS